MNRKFLTNLEMTSAHSLLTMTVLNHSVSGSIIANECIMYIHFLLLPPFYVIEYGPMILRHIMSHVLDSYFFVGKFQYLMYLFLVHLNVLDFLTIYSTSTWSFLQVKCYYIFSHAILVIME